MGELGYLGDYGLRVTWRSWVTRVTCVIMMTWVTWLSKVT